MKRFSPITGSGRLRQAVAGRRSWSTSHPPGRRFISSPRLACGHGGPACLGTGRRLRAGCAGPGRAGLDGHGHPPRGLRAPLPPRTYPDLPQFSDNTLLIPMKTTRIMACGCWLLALTTLEADGVAFAAIQGLNQKMEATRAENAALKH